MGLQVGFVMFQWMFGQALAEQTEQENYNEEDKEFARKVLSYISNFAKTG